MQSKTKNVMIIVLIIGIISMTVAYAAFTTQLSISATAKVNNTKWEVKIDNWAQETVSNLNGGTSEATVKANPSITDTAITGIEVTFNKPGDAVRFTFNIKNTGGVDAKLTNVSGMTETKDGVTKTVKCGATPAAPTANSSAFEVAKTSGVLACTMDISYNKDATTMPGTLQTTALSDVIFTYGQK